MLLDQDTIVAIATAPGRGGIGIVRLSGPESVRIAESLVRVGGALMPAKARFGRVVDASGAVLDEAVVTWFRAPHSYTTEDVVEIAAHGAPVLLRFLVEGAVKAGARLAEPGEFTRRAFLAGRLDLTQAEAVNDLIAAQTLHQAKTAAAQLGGVIAHAVRPVKQSLLSLIAALEAGVDFVEDDLDLLSDDEVVRRLQEVQAPLEALAKSYAYGRLVREGLTVAIVGAPNAGKSSLFNRLLERERAIVTALPGTTRDTITEELALAGIPLHLVDTAGLREIAATPETEAERAGIERSRRALADADLVLHVIDSTSLVRNAAGDQGGLRPEDRALAAELAGRPSILVFNKIDLETAALPEEGEAVLTSARTGAGIEALREAILRTTGAQPRGDTALITNLRQSRAIHDALASLKKAGRAAQEHISQELFLLDLQDAQSHLDELTGATTADAVLDLIFAGFCIGK